jgi:hypothetical protein
MSQLKSMQDDASPVWLPRLAVHGGPRFLQIADALQAAVAERSLKPGDRLPPQRRLAAQLDVDLTTITRAYDEAIAALHRLAVQAYCHRGPPLRRCALP